MCSLEAGRRAADNLQRDILQELSSHELERPVQVSLDHGSEVTDLRHCVDVRVSTDEQTEVRVFTICSLQFVERTVLHRGGPAPRQDSRDLYTVGGPLIIVRDVTASAVVRGILYYLDVEAGRAGI